MIELNEDTPAPERLQLSPKEAGRFWKRVIRKAMDECWEWSSKGNSAKYGAIRIRGKSQLAHRVSFEIHHHLLKPGEFSLHRCDNPRCVNPAHLFAGDHVANQQDRDAKGRQAKGEVHGRAIMDESGVILLRKLRSDGVLYRELAALFGISIPVAWFIANRKIWRHVP